MQHSDFSWRADRVAIDAAGSDILTDVRVDPDAPMLSFHRGGVARSCWVDEQGVIALRGADERPSPIVELTLDGGEGCQPIWLAPIDRRGPGHWGQARLVHLGCTDAPDPGAAFQSFLAQVSGALAELQHDMRQPLAAISLAAHNGEGLFNAGRAQQAIAKFATIRQHVQRCEERIHAGMSWIDADGPGAAVEVRFASAVHAALAALRPSLGDAEITLHVSGALPTGSVRALPGAVEMMLGFILRQSVKVVSGSSAPRLVEVVLDERAARLHVTVRHSGMADDGEAVCDDIALAMAHRLVGQACGELVVPSPAACRRGMAATLSFPRCDGIAAQAADQFAFASSLR